MRRVLTTLAAVSLLGSGSCLMTGCISTGGIEGGMNQMIHEVIKPAVEKMAGELSARTAQLQGQGSLINPGYEISGFVSVGPAATFQFTLQAIGVSANLTGAAQADAGQAGTVPPPVMRDETPEP